MRARLALLHAALLFAFAQADANAAGQKQVTSDAPPTATFELTPTEEFGSVIKQYLSPSWTGDSIAQSIKYNGQDEPATTLSGWGIELVRTHDPCDGCTPKTPGDASHLQLTFQSTRHLSFGTANKGFIKGVIVDLYNCKKDDADCGKKPGAGSLVRSMNLSNPNELTGGCQQPRWRSYGSFISNEDFALANHAVVTILPDNFWPPTVPCK